MSMRTAVVDHYQPFITAWRAADEHGGGLRRRCGALRIQEKAMKR